MKSYKINVEYTENIQYVMLISETSSKHCIAAYSRERIKNNSGTRNPYVSNFILEWNLTELQNIFGSSSVKYQGGICNLTEETKINTDFIAVFASYDFMNDKYIYNKLSSVSNKYNLGFLFN